MIKFEDICKTYRVARRESGFGNAVESFTITKRVILIGRGQKLLDGTLEDLCLEAMSVKSESNGSEADIDHIIASLYKKLNIM